MAWERSEVPSKRRTWVSFLGRVLQVSRELTCELRQQDIPSSGRLSHKPESTFALYAANLAVYSGVIPDYASKAVGQLGHLCRSFGLGWQEVLANDAYCRSRKGRLYLELGGDTYYEHPLYASHLWVENVAARRVYFAFRIKEELVQAGFELPQLRLLEVGCGLGGTIHLFEESKERVGVDLSPVATRACQAISDGKEHYAVMDGRNMGFSSGEFDLVLCFDVLEHLGDPEAALAEIARVAVEGGRIAIVYPFGDREWDSHISLVEVDRFEQWLDHLALEVRARLKAPGEEFPCSICYILSK